METEDNLKDRPRLGNLDVDDDDHDKAETSEQGGSSGSIDAPDAGEPYTDP